MRKFLKNIQIIQEKDNRGRKVKLGRGFQKAYRFNPYNPLSYIVIPIILIVAIIMFGFVGFTREIDCTNPFKWN